jgi:hypothetical protein
MAYDRVERQPFQPNPNNPLEHEGHWEIIEMGDDGHPLYWGEHGWQPIRLVISRWKASNKPKYGACNWDSFHGESGSKKGTQYYRSFCVHRPASRILHQEEMNLYPCRGREGEILMHDPIIQSTNLNRVTALNNSLSKAHELPIIHVVMNVDDYGSSARSLDVFIKDYKLDQTNFLSRYDPNYGPFNAHMTSTIRNGSASSELACGSCAEEGEVNMIVIDSQKNYFGNYFGRRGYGLPIPQTAVAGASPRSWFAFTMPSGGRLAIPKRIMDEIMTYRRWRGVKIYPNI